MIRRLAFCACLISLLNACGGAALNESPQVTHLPSANAPHQIAPTLPEFRRLMLDYPPTIKLGSGAQHIVLILEADAQDDEILETQNLYETHKITAEAYFEMAGISAAPRGATFQPLRAGERLRFVWEIQPQEIGSYRGTIFFFLNFENRETGEKSRKALAIQILDINVVDFFGFSTRAALTFGVVGFVLAVAIGFPFFESAFKELYRRFNRKRKSDENHPKKRRD